MHEKFKKGDRVVYTDIGPWDGVTGTVVGYRHSYILIQVDADATYKNGNKIDPDYKTESGAARMSQDHCILLIPPEPTDEELAQKYRDLHRALNDAGDALRSRGYTIRRGSQVINTATHHTTISKTVTKEL